MTWSVAFVPSLILREDGTICHYLSQRPQLNELSYVQLTTSPMQNCPIPSSRKIGSSVILKFSPTSFPSPSSTCTSAWSCSMFNCTGPPDKGKRLRLLLGVSWPPQGKVASVSSSKPRAGGELSWKWAVTRVRGRMMGRKGRKAERECMLDRCSMEF